MVVFLRSVATILTLRVHLYFRRLRTRGWAIRIAGYVGPLVSLLGLMVVWSGTDLVAKRSDPAVVAAVVSLILLGAHIYVLFSVVARITSNQGLAAALYSFPLSPAVIHTSEAAAGFMTPAVAVPGVILASASFHLGGPSVLAFAWSLLVWPYLAGLRQLLSLALAELLRRRFAREVAFGLVTVAMLGGWIALNRFIARYQQIDPVAALEALPSTLWLLPSSWFVTPFAALEVPIGVRILGLVGVPMLAFATFVVGYDLQDAACYGEAPSLVRRRKGPRRRRRRLHLADRMPFRLIPAPVWATAAKELTVLKRNPFMLFSMGTQAALLFLPVLIFEPEDVDAMAGGWVRMVAILLLFVEHSVLFNQIGSEGRALAFLSQTPVSRAHVLLGKNLGYGSVLFLINVVAVSGACTLFGMTDELPSLLGVLVAGQIVFTGIGNFVSVWLPIPIVGARAAAGGTRAATAATGDVEPPGCGHAIVRGLVLQSTLLLLIPAGLLLYLVPWWLPEALPFAVAAAMSWALLIYIVATLLAVRRLEVAEERLLQLIAVRGAA
ncbi:MAG: hypothetical protein GY898_34115 [Proteobacteria bacterium]|nr:hypothetical protein [Pseudomonadota bacterium]